MFSLLYKINVTFQDWCSRSWSLCRWSWRNSRRCSDRVRYRSNICESSSPVAIRAFEKQEYWQSFCRQHLEPIAIQECCSFIHKFWEAHSIWNVTYISIHQCKTSTICLAFHTNWQWRFWCSSLCVQVALHVLTLSEAWLPKTNTQLQRLLLVWNLTLRKWHCLAPH